MGKGDQRTKKGKINRGTSGKSRPKKVNKAKKLRLEQKAKAAAAAASAPRRAG